MNYKFLVFVSLLLLLLPIPAQADSSERLLLLYMTADGEMNERIVMAEANLSAFVDSIDVIAAEDIRPETVQTYKHIVVVGDAVAKVPENIQRELRQFNGMLLVFGHNADQLPQFQKWDFIQEQRISSVDGDLLDVAKSVVHAIPPKGSTLLAEAETIDQRIPYIVRHENVSFIATTEFSTEEKYVLSRALYDIFDVKHPMTHPAYIQLEGITPISKVNDVREAGEYLADHGIPFILSVTPVHVNPETAEKVLLSTNKELVEELKLLQMRGGVVIVNGYDHSYRLDEQFVGYEFWDMKLNQPIGSSPIDLLPSSIQSPTHFSSNEDYMNYRAADLQAESAMVHTKQRLAIEHLVDVGLYPIGVKIPQYTMSANGYAATSEYFTTLFGRMQVSDTDGHLVNMPLFVSKPSRLSGMTLYPETIGYVEPDEAEPLEEMKQNINKLQTVPGSVIGGLYHTYIGASYLPKMVRLMESVPGMKWIDFSKMNPSVHTPDITIRYTEEGAQSTSSITKWQKWTKMIQENPINASLWMIVVVVALFLVAFAVYVLSLRLRLKKRLFEERDRLG
ncbi:hypothetical protein CSV72_13770 [Sporosarcina sp. P20a]|uniref:DUF2334 domain-containing protein n=1 Tax=Sporosarcina sp. P20a TaxID=2048256 RepID=UPI000C1677DB|nr:DUF2334 domain-containing protein [Sporosarcina sp. P20a]PIC85393.1 hypothetical protein CSV72_13770 [Sporosarcina sp. P20a]